MAAKKSDKVEYQLLKKNLETIGELLQEMQSDSMSKKEVNDAAYGASILLQPVREVFISLIESHYYKNQKAIERSNRLKHIRQFWKESCSFSQSNSKRFHSPYDDPKPKLIKNVKDLYARIYRQVYVYERFSEKDLKLDPLQISDVYMEEGLLVMHIKTKTDSSIVRKPAKYYAKRDLICALHYLEKGKREESKND